MKDKMPARINAREGTSEKEGVLYPMCRLYNTNSVTDNRAAGTSYASRAIRQNAHREKMPQRRLRRRHPHVTFRTKREREAIIQKWMGSQWRPANSRARLGCFNHSAVVAARARASPPLFVAKKVKDSRIKTPIQSMVRAHFSRHRALRASSQLGGE